MQFSQHPRITRITRTLIAASLLVLGLTLTACQDNPGKWPKEKLAEHVKESLIKQEIEVTGVTLGEKVGESYEGTANVAGGETLKLTVKQDAAASRITWEAKGDRGSELDGSYELK